MENFAGSKNYQKAGGSRPASCGPAPPGGDARRGYVRHFGPRHREHRLDHRILIVAAARDRLHRRGVKQAAHDEAVVDVHADHLAERHVAVERPAFEIAQRQGVQPFAFERAGGPRRRAAA